MAELLTRPDEAIELSSQLLLEELTAIDISCSRFRLDSELCRVNKSAGRWVDVSPLFSQALAAALAAAAQTGGAVDPTVGRSLRLLGYDRDFALVPAEGSAVPASTGPVPGWQQVELDGKGQRVRVPPGVELDLGATGKAFASDRAAKHISEAAGASVLVSLGGDVAVAGPPPPELWLVHVTDDQRGPIGEEGQSVLIGSGGLATSSATVRRWQRGGRWLHHIIDPATGTVGAGPWRTASVAAATCADANAGSTAALVKGEAAVTWLEGAGLPARLVAWDGTVRVVNGWPPFPLEP